MQEWLNRKAEEHVTSFWQLQEVTMEKRGAAGRKTAPSAPAPESQHAVWKQSAAHTTPLQKHR